MCIINAELKYEFKAPQSPYFTSLHLPNVISFLQRASQIRSVPFTGDSSDSDSEGGFHGDVGSNPGRASSNALHPEDIYDGVFRGTASSRNTTATSATTMTSSTSGGDVSSISCTPHGGTPRGIGALNQHKLASTSAVAHLKHSSIMLNHCSATNTAKANASAANNRFGKLWSKGRPGIKHNLYLTFLNRVLKDWCNYLNINCLGDLISRILSEFSWNIQSILESINCNRSLLWVHLCNYPICKYRAQPLNLKWTL